MLIAKTKEKNVNISLHSLKLIPIAETFGITISKVSFKSLFIGPGQWQSFLSWILLQFYICS